MPGPPPPPPAAPPPMMPPPPPIFNPSPSKGGSDDRSALLKSIRQGTKLKKTVTVDKSAPLIGGKVSSSISSSNNVAGGNHTGHNTNSTPMPNDLGNIFAGGMPKLRPTGRNLGEKQSNHVNTSNHSNNNLSNSNRQKSPDIQPQTAKSFTSIQNELKKQMASDNRNRGPPPPAPVRNNSDLSNTRHPFVMKNGSVNGLHTHKNTSAPQPSSLYPNSSTLHRKANSSVNLSPVEGVESTINNNLPVKPVINHGKPHLAPKPPLNGKPAAPPKKLIMNGKPISRAQSMKSPRSPSPQSPDGITATIKFGTVRNLTAVVNQSLANSTGNLSSPRQRPPIATRPNAPPPSIPQHNSVQPPPPPSKISMVKPPSHAPPPPPNAPLPQPPNHAPPLPPHRTGPVRGAPAIPQNNTVAPPPPPRHSSIRDGNVTTRRTTHQCVDLEVKFAKEFHSVSQFPRPGPYIGFFKTYRSKQVGSKQQAPQPPNHLQVSNRTWDSSSC